MIDLSDSVWRDLSHCYGYGSDVPPMLQRVETAKRLSKGFWDEFTNLLCHQCTIGTASIAAFPHLVRIAKSDPSSRKAFDSMLLASWILTLALGPENKLPRMENLLGEPFRRAIAEGRRVLVQMYDHKRPSLKANMLYLSMVAAFDRRADIAAFLGESCQGWFACPRCEEKIEMEDVCTW